MEKGRRSAGETVGYAVAVVLAGAVVAFVVAVVASFLGLSGAVTWVVVLLALAGFAYITYRGSADRAPAAVEKTGPPPATAAATMREERAMSDAPLVGIVMGSQSDMTVMEECATVLAGFGVPCEVVVASAHRQPEKVHEWASAAAERGMRVIVAGAGKAAHLGGVVAALTPLPVIAVPMKTSDLGGLDSLLSMVQMPSGVPVACVAINGAKNAAILAIQILGTSMPEYREGIVAMKREMAGD